MSCMTCIGTACAIRPRALKGVAGEVQTTQIITVCYKFETILAVTGQHKEMMCMRHAHSYALMICSMLFATSCLQHAVCNMLFATRYLQQAVYNMMSSV